MLVICPHCKDYVFIEKLNCRIFRHACYKNGEPIPPHASKEECETLLEKNMIYGCAKPFQILQDGSVIVCEYI